MTESTSPGRDGGPNVDFDGFADDFERIATSIEQIIKGKPEVIRLAVACMLAGGHLLIEDVPGVGKTSLARALAETIDGSLQRIQFTPDLLPTDVTGVQIWNGQNHEFEFHEGAVFANVVVADEINRASPKTQAALLEVMEEHQVSVDGTPRLVPDPFIVIATQNPIERLPCRHRSPRSTTGEHLTTHRRSGPRCRPEQLLRSPRTRR